jgi:hypothetical protein
MTAVHTQCESRTASAFVSEGSERVKTATLSFELNYPPPAKSARQPAERARAGTPQRSRHQPQSRDAPPRRPPRLGLLLAGGHAAQTGPGRARFLPTVLASPAGRPGPKTPKRGTAASRVAAGAHGLPSPSPPPRSFPGRAPAAPPSSHPSSPRPAAAQQPKELALLDHTRPGAPAMAGPRQQRRRRRPSA